MLNSLLRRFGVELRRYQPQNRIEAVSLKTDGACSGAVLLAYIIDPFLLSQDEEVSRKHTHHIESLKIAEAFLKSGYDVDVIHYRNAAFKPSRDYAFFVSARTNFAQIAARLNSDCIKIAHLDTAHFLFNNAAAYRRLLEMQGRRQAAASSLKVIEQNWAPEHCDYIAALGNKFTLDTYRYAGKHMFTLPVPTLNTYESPVSKDFNAIRKNFLWFGSGGLVHKGLDIALEAFSRLPDFQLTVCGPLDAVYEKEFRQIYHRELYETGNIKSIGWIDVGSEEFLAVARNCVGLIYPSCSEGQSGAVVTCMQAGLIPVISYESGVDVDDFGMLLDDCSIDGVTDAVTRVSELSESELSERAVKTWEHARAHHTADEYLLRYRKMIDAILADRRVP